MTRSSHRPIYAFVRRGNVLIPDMDYDMRALDGVKEGQKVRVEVKQWRNLDRLRAYWATLRDCVEATGCAPTPEALDAYVRIAVGHVDTIGLANGIKVAVARPINTRECEEPEMVQFFDAANELLAREFGFVTKEKL